jgi:hypothetical protein
VTGRGLAASLAKEGRALLPLWEGCLAILLGAEIFGAPIRRSYLLIIYAFGAIALGAHALGQEYAHRTLPMVMTLPVPRRQILAAKLAVTAMMVLAVSVAVWITMADTPALRGSGAERVLLLVGMAAVTIAPALTAASHSSVAGVVFTIATAAIVWMAGDIVGAWRFGPGNAAAVDAFRQGVFWPTMFTLCAVAAAATWWMFPRLEALQGRGRELHFPTWTTGHDRADQAGRRAPVLLLLIAKELRLQQMTFAVSGLYVVALAVQIVILQLDAEAWTQWLIPVAVFHALAVAGLAGSLASAEERQLGTWQSQQLLPVTAWQQWLVKVGVALTITMGLGIGLTWAFSFALPGLRGGPGARMAVSLPLLVAFALYVSSLSRSGIRAVVGMVVAFGGLTVLYFPLSNLLWRLASSWSLAGARRVRPPLRDELSLGMLVLAAGVLLILAHRNHRSDDTGITKVVYQVAALGLLWLGLSFLAFILGL